MFQCLFILLAAMAICLAVNPRAQATAASNSQPPKRLGLCAACHGKHGIANEHSIPNLASQNLQYMKIAVDQYRHGQRDFAAMRAALGMLNASEVDQILGWYAMQPPAQSSPRP